MDELEYQLQKLQQDPNTSILNTPEPTPMDKLLNTRNSKLDTLSNNRVAKELRLRKDSNVYEEDNMFTQGLKEVANMVLPHEYQIGVNKFGGQYNTANKTFNEDDLTGIWNKYQDDPAGNKSLYYLRKQDPYTGKYVYKPGIAETSAAERYLTQEKADGWELLGEKRFNEASEVEKQIHGNKEFLQSRVFDRGTTGEGGADNFFGAGKSELYDKDILGLDTGTSEDYRKLQDASYDKMFGLIPNDKQKEDTFEFIDALQAGGITLGAQAIKLIGETVGTSDEDNVVEAFGKKLQKDANKIAGYNPVASAEAMKGLEDSFNRGNYVDYAFNMAKGAPQWLAQSLPNMAAFAAVSAGTTAATGGNVGAGLAAGSAFMGAIRANDVLDNREEITGRKATGEEVAAIYGVSSALSLLEYGALKYAFSGKGLIVKDPAGNSKNLGKELFKNNTKLGEVAMWLGNRGKGSAAEGGEEVIAGLTEFVMENYGTEKYMGQSIGDLLTSDTARTTAIQSFGAGAGAGGLASVVGTDSISGIDRAITAGKVKEVASKDFSKEQQDYVDGLRTEQNLGKDDNLEMTAEQKAVFESMAVDPEAELDQTIEDIKDPEKELQDIAVSDLNDINTKIEELEAQREAVSSKDPEALSEIDVEIGKLEAEKDSVKNKLVEDVTAYNVAANVDKMKKEGATDEEITAATDRLEAKLLEMRGVAATPLTAQDKADGLTIELARPDEVLLKNKSKKKAQVFEAYDVKDETLKEIVQGGFTLETAKKLVGKVQSSKITESLVKHFRAESSVVAELETIQKSINDTIDTDAGKAALGNLMDENTENRGEKALRMVALALAQVKSNIASEYHVNKNAGLKPSAQHARASDIVEQLGKDYLNSYDIKYAGKAEPLARKNAEIGQQILDFAEEAGLITQGDARVSALGLVDAEGKNISDKDTDTLGLYMNVAGTEINANNKPVTMIKTQVVTLNDNVGKKAGVVDSAKAYAATVLASILRPTNIEVPGTVPVEEIPSDTDNLSETHQEIIRKMNAMKFNIKPESLELFYELRELIYGKDGSGSFDKGSKKPEVKELLDLLGVKADVNKDKDSGRSLNKTNNLRNILDNLDVLDPNNMYYNYESAINQRIHVMQTILDFQGDKYMARNVVTGGQYTTDTKEEYQLVVDSVEDALGKSVSDQVFDTPVNAVGKGKLPLKYLLRLDKKLGVGNPFKTLVLVKAVKDIREAKGNKISTDYMVEVDASASGVTNTLLNRAGDPEVQKILQKMTIMGGTMDPYGIVNEGVKNPDINPDFEEEVQPILDRFAKILGDPKKAMRQIAKYPVMTWFYGSSTGNVATLMGEDMTLEVVESAVSGNVEAIKLVNELTESKYNKGSIVNLTDQDILTMKQYYSDNVGKIYAGSMEQMFPGVAEYRSDMNKIFDILKSTGKWNGTFPTAMAALEGTPTENKMSIRKRKQTVGQKLGQARYEQILSKMFDNKTSMSVNPQHATDAALLLKAMEAVMNRHPELQGVMTVHDATYGNPKILLEVKAEYDKLTVDTANKYDFVAAAISEAREAIAKVEKDSIQKSLTKQIDEIEAKNKKLQESKTEFLKGKTVSVLEGAKTTKPKETTEVVEEVVPEPKAEPTEGYIGVVFNTYGRVYDYKVDDINKYKDGDVLNSFGTTYTVKYARADKDYKLKEGIEYKNIKLITKDEVDTAKVEVSLTDQIQEVTDEINKGGSFLSLIDLVKSLEVSDVNQKVKDKVIEALTSGKINVDTNKVYGSLPGQIMLGLNGKDFRFDKRNGEAFTADSFIETVGHEVDHAYNWSYIANNKSKAEVKYLTKVMNRLLNMDTGGLSEGAKNRIEYIRDTQRKQDDESALAETVSILNNEGEVATEILQALPDTWLKRTIATVKELLKLVGVYMSTKSPTELKDILESDTGIRTENVIIALKVLENETMAQTEEQITGVEATEARRVVDKKKTQADVNVDAYLNPYKYADGIIAKGNGYTATLMRVFGGTVIDLLSPAIGEAHKKASRKSELYRTTMSLIRTGFVDSEIAQKMRSTIGVARHIDTVVLNEMLSMADAINQETKTILTTDLANMDNRIKKLYPDIKDQTKIYKLFAKTGISGLQYDKEILGGIVDGTMTLDEAIAKATEGVEAGRLKKLEDIAKYYVTGETDTMHTNLEAAELYEMNDKVIVALYALNGIPKAQEMLSGMNKGLKQDMIAIAVSVQALSDEINMREPGPDGKMHTDEAKYSVDYDGNYMMDVYDKKFEYKIVSKYDMQNSKYTDENDWIVVKEVNKDGIGLIARERLDQSLVPGVGLNTNKFNNGFHMTEEDADKMAHKLDGMKPKEAEAFMKRNNIVRDGDANRFRFVLDEKTKVGKLGMRQSAADSLMRTYAHNMELVQMQSVRNLMLEKATAKLDKDGMQQLNKDIIFNRSRGRGVEAKVMPMFVTIDYKYQSYDSLPKWVKNEYRTPNNLSTYNGFNRKVQLVRKGEADILLGHKSFSFFGGTENRNAAKWERGFKELVVLAKQKMVVANAGKLAVDIVSNMGILTAKDVSLFEIKKYGVEGFKEYTDFSRKRTEIVNLELQYRMGVDGAEKKLRKAEEDLKKHKFYDSFKYGFVQSYSTSLVTQDYDTLAGLQHDIDAIVEGITKDKKGNPNEVYKAIKWWQEFGDKKGLGVDHLIKWASEISKVKGTYIGDEMASMAKRLRDKKDVNSVARYVGDIIGSPASELVTLGGAVMVSADAISKYTLAQSLMDRTNPKVEGNAKYTKEEAYMEANETFIDYRQNMPSEIKMLSDYGVMLFPSFWIKAQKVIAGLVMYHPATALGGYAIADALDVSSANFLDVNAINRVMDGRLMNDPTNLVDWEILSPWL